MRRERRRSKRIKIDHEFHVSLYNDDSQPNIEEFVPVEALDISRDGIAIVTDRFEVGDRIILILGPPEGKVIMVVAEVVRIAAVRFGAVYRPVTGCEFTERLEQEHLEQYKQGIGVAAAQDTNSSTIHELLSDSSLD